MTKEKEGTRVNARELTLDILMEILERGALSHVVLRQALDKYQYLDKQDRALITRLTDGTLEYLIQIDYILGQYSRTPVSGMKPLIRTLLRMSVYQILYMDRIPDSAVCNEAVKLAQKRHFHGLKGFVNGVLRTVAREKGNLEFPDESIRYGMPRWILERDLSGGDREGYDVLVLREESVHGPAQCEPGRQGADSGEPGQAGSDREGQRIHG